MEKTRGFEWPDFIHPTYREKTLNAVKADSKVYRDTFSPAEANPGEVLNVHVPRLSENMVIVPGSLALVFEIDLTGGHADNFLVQNVTRALVSRMDVKFGGTELQTTQGYGLYKLFEDLFLSKEKRDNMLLEGIQTEDLCKIRSDSGDKKTSGVDAENALAAVYGKKYRIRLDHPILTENGVFYPEGLYSNLMFQITLAPASEVVKGSDATKLTYKLKNIQREYETINSSSLADETLNVYNSGKSIPYEYVYHPNYKDIAKDTDNHIIIKVDTQRLSLKAIILLFEDPYTPGARDSEKFVFPDITKVKVSVNGRPNMVYDSGLEARDLWEQAYRFFGKEKGKTQNMDMKKFYTGEKFGLVIDMRTTRDQTMHGSGKRVVGSNEGVQLELDRKTEGSGTMKCHVYVLSDAQFDIMGRAYSDHTN